MELKQPTGCAGKGSHPAKVRAWILENAFNDSLLHGEFECYVSTQGWNKQWRRFRFGKGYAICLCDSAFQELREEAVRVGLIW